VIFVIIGNAKIDRLLVDTGSSYDILFLSMFEHMEKRKKLEEPTGPLLGFTGFSTL